MCISILMVFNVLEMKSLDQIFIAVKNNKHGRAMVKIPAGINNSCGMVSTSFLMSVTIQQSKICF
jgi:hypothetical protein